MAMARQTFAFIGVKHIDARAVVYKHVFRVYSYHAVAKPVVGWSLAVNFRASLGEINAFIFYPLKLKNNNAA